MSGGSLLLGTNIVLYFLGGDGTLTSILEENELYISVITEIELLGYQKLSEAEIGKIQEFLSYCKILNLSENVKESAIKLRKSYKLKLPDAIILGTALSYETAFITADKDFSFYESDLTRLPVKILQVVGIEV